ncbi:MAG TPA: glycosyltransferase family 2 protein [Xanthomonadales bacterium]|nr:glycosyltransferase family 2 protein [Xanthomonadales bacterium]
MKTESVQRLPQSIPLLSIIIPTHNRPHMLMTAVQSALAQTLADIEVIVVDDGSQPPAELPELPRLRLLRLDTNQGHATARNVGAAAARAERICFLDDDDSLLPHMAEVSLAALNEPVDLPLPIIIMSGLDIINPDGSLLERHFPPTLPKGAHYSLERIVEGKSIYCKQTAVIPREVYLQIGGCDTRFRSRVHSELFFRLNAACSIFGIESVTYRLLQHTGPRITRDREQRRLGFSQLVNKHRGLFEQHPQQFSWYYRDHALRCWRARHLPDAASAALHSLRWQVQAWITGRH